VNTVKSNFTGLQTLQRQVGELTGFKAQVGLFADNAGRVAERGRIAHNPSLGYIHEFGMTYSVVSTKTTISIPERSWLRVPLMLHLAPLVQETGARWFALMARHGVKRGLAHLGTLAEDVIQEAFATGGYGLWPALAPHTVRRKGSSAILIETAQMRRAIASRVV